MTEKEKKPWWRWLLLIVGGSIAVGIPCLFVLVLLGPTIGRLYGMRSTHLSDPTACITSAQRARDASTAPVSLASFDLADLPPGPTLTADNATQLQEIARFPLETGIGRSIEFLDDQEIAIVADPDGDDLPMAIRPDGDVAAVIEVYGIEEYGVLRLCDVATGDQLAAHMVKDSTHQAAFTPDGSGLVVNQGRGTLTLYDAQTFETVKNWPNVRRGEPFQIIVGLAVHPGSRLVAYAGNDDYTLRVWDLEAGEEVAHLSGHTFDVVDLAFSPDGSRLASLSLDGSLRVWAVGE